MRARRRSGFTLIELIVVCAIIAVLLALLMGGFGAGGRSARRLAGLSEARGMAEAISQYRERYRQWPPGVAEVGEPSRVQGRLVRVLTAEVFDALNPARIRFFTFKQYAEGTDGTLDREAPLTPWGRRGNLRAPEADAFFYVKVDVDRDGRIDEVFGSFAGMPTSTTVRADVAVWAVNADVGADSDLNRYVGSWE